MAEMPEHSAQSADTREVIPNGENRLKTTSGHEPERILNKRLARNLMKIEDIEFCGKFNKGFLLGVEGAF
jgi:hypothetical protein